jgi:hypothetical protein
MKNRSHRGEVLPMVNVAQKNEATTKNPLEKENITLESISPTFYELHFRQFSCVKKKYRLKLQAQK